MSDSAQIDPRPVPYFSTVRLRHAKGAYLAAFDFIYTHDGTSGQFVVGCVENPDDATLWIVRPPHRQDYEKSGDDHLEEGAVIRLQHVLTGKNLHSHGNRAPVSGDRHEVTTLGEKGFCNQDDDWLIRAKQQQGVNTSTQLSLFHVQTSHFLHSHNDHHFEAGGMRLQEVTCLNGEDENTIWEIVDVFPTTGKFVLHPFLEFTACGQSHRFNRVSELQTWLDAEKEGYAWAQIGGGHSRVYGIVNSRFTELVAAARGCARLSSTNTEFYNACRTLDSRIESTLNNGLLPVRGDSRLDFVLSLKDREPVVATHALAYFCGADLEQQPQSLKGFFLATCFEHGVSDRASVEAQALEKLRLEKETSFDAVQAAVDGAKAKIEAEAKRGADMIAANEKRVEKLIEEGIKGKANLEKTYDQDLSLRASVSYWRSKSRFHAFIAFVFGSGAVVAGYFVVTGLIQLAKDVLKDTGENPPHWWEVALVVIVATFGIWAVRVCVQIMYSNTHLAADAKERSTMILTYLAMLREQVLPTTDQQKLLILQSLFRPGSTGVVKDDGSPTTWLDFIANKIGKP